MKINEAIEGRRVYYRPGYKEEAGVITSFNDTYVFVLYDGDTQSKATKPEDLYYE